MVRLVSLALLLAIVETPGWSQSNGSAPKALWSETWRVSESGVPRSPFALPRYLSEPLRGGADIRMIAGKEVSPNTALGLGMFGFKRDRAALPPVTVYEVNTRQSRKPGLGFSLKF